MIEAGGTNGQPIDQLGRRGLRSLVRAACVPALHGAALIAGVLAGAAAAFVKDAGPAAVVPVHGQIEKALKPWLREYQADDPKIEELGVRPRDQQLTEAEAKRYSAFAREGLKRRAAELAETLRGARNDTFFRTASCFGKYAHFGLIPWEEIYSTFHQACEVNRLIRDKGLPAFNRTFNSARARSANDPLPNLLERPYPGSAKAGGQTNGERKPGLWGEPGEITSTLPPVAAFDEKALLPPSVRDFVADAAWRMPCPADYIAAALIIAAGATIGTKCAVKPKQKDDWHVVSNLWGGIVGDPSQKKSPAISAGMAPISMLISKDKKDFEEVMAKSGILSFVEDAKVGHLKSLLKAAAKKGDDAKIEKLTKELQEKEKDKEVPIKKRRRKTNDATVEKVGEMLSQNGQGLLVVRDELTGLLASWDKVGHEGEREFYLEAWNGISDFDTDRIGRGEIYIPNLCLSLFGGIQPDKLTAYLDQTLNALSNDGMLQRFQVLVYPDPVPWEYRDEYPNRPARETVREVFEKLDSFNPLDWGAEPANPFVKFPHFKFSPEAQQTFIGFVSNLETTKEKEDNRLIKQHLAKYEKLFAAIALIMHLLECAFGGKRGPITNDAAKRAAAWCDYLESHARRCYALVADNGLRSAQALAERLKNLELPKGFNLEDFTARDIRRNQWRYLTSEEAVQAALDWLEDENWISSRKAGGEGRGSGRATVRYELNPKVRTVKSEGL